jgi:uncharacterized protein (TIGR02453 family)
MFAGFAKDAPGFFHELSIEMNRDWFLANKERYEATWVAPMSELLAEVRGRLAKVYGKLGEPKIMRIHRDVRFAKNKQPYKTHIGASIATAKDHTALYIHLGVDEEFVGCGAYYFEPAALAKWRKLVAGKAGEPLAKLIAKLRKAGYTVGGHDDYVRVPKPYAAEHPRAALLKQKGLTGAFPEMPRGLLHKPGLVDWLVTHGKAMAPLVTWLDEHV